MYFTYYGSVELKGKSDDFLKKCTKNESNKVLFGDLESEWYDQEYGLKQ